MISLANSLTLWGPSARVTSCPAIDFLDALALHASMQCDAYFGSSPRILSWGETRGTLPCARRKGVGSRAAPVAGRGALREEDGEEESAAFRFFSLSHSPLSFCLGALPRQSATFRAPHGALTRWHKGPHPTTPWRGGREDALLCLSRRGWFREVAKMLDCLSFAPFWRLFW